MQDFGILSSLSLLTEKQTFCSLFVFLPTLFVSCPPGIPLELIKPEALGHKVFEPLLLLGKQRWGFLDIRLRVKGGGHVSQIYGKQAQALCYSNHTWLKPID